MTEAQRQAPADELIADLDLGSPLFETHDVPHDVYRVLREQAPVKRVHPRGKFLTGSSAEWFISRYSDVLRVFHDDDTFSSDGLTGTPGPVPTDIFPFEEIDPYIVAIHSQKIPLGLDPPTFSVYRRLLNPLFHPAEARKAEASTREIATTLLRQIDVNTGAEFHQQLAKPLPAMTVCRLFGLPEEEWERFAYSTPESQTFTARQADPDRDALMAQVIPTLDSQMTMLRLAKERRETPQDDIITAVAHLTINGRLLGWYELGAILSVLLSGGVHTTTMAIESALAFLGRDPDVQEALAKNPHLINTFCEEVLRMWPPLPFFFRSARRDVVIANQTIAAGDGLVLGLASANRDQREFPHPDVFDLHRHPNRHLTFAVGIHRCLGSNLARQELNVAIEEVLRQLPPFVLQADGVRIPPMGAHLPNPDRSLPATFVPTDGRPNRLEVSAADI